MSAMREEHLRERKLWIGGLHTTHNLIWKKGLVLLVTFSLSLSLSLTPASTCTAELAVNTLARVTQSKQIKGYSDVLGNRCRFFTGKIIVQTIFSVGGTGYTVPMQF
jgi:hypothetical protein